MSQQPDTQESQTIILAAGGTGGHLFPARALAEALIRRGHHPVLLTDARGQKLGGAGAIETRVLPVVGGKNTIIGQARMALSLFGSYLQAERWLHELKPSVVVAFGGYPCVPTALAGLRQGRRLVIHEQNSVLGKANRLLAPKAEIIATAFPSLKNLPTSIGADRMVQTGNPVRHDIAALRAVPFQAPTADEPFHILVVGGSQGASVFSEIVPAAIGLLPDFLRKKLVIVQQARPADIEDARLRYARIQQKVDLQPFFADMPQRLADAHLVISRAGASTVAELTAAGRPAILVPYPNATDDHQTHNADAVANIGGAWLMPQPAFTAEALAARLETLLTLPARLSEMAEQARAWGRVDAADRLADLVLGQNAKSMVDAAQSVRHEESLNSERLERVS